MSTDLLYSQPVAQYPSAGTQSGKIGPSGSDRSAGIQSFHDAPKGDRDNFLSTLEHVTQDRSSTQRPERAGGSQSDQTTAKARADKIDDASDHGAVPADAAAQTEPEEQPDSIAAEWNWTALIKLLESLGFNPATDTSDLQARANANPADTDLIAVIEALMARFQQPQSGLTADLKSGLEQLQHFLSTALGTIDGVSGQGLGSSQVSELAQINQWLNGLTAGGAETVVNSLAMNGSSSGTATLQGTEQSAVLSQSENRIDADQKLSADSSPLIAKDDPDAKTARAVENATVDASKTKEPMGAGRYPQRAERTEIPQDQAGMRDTASAKSSASSGPDPAVVKLSEGQSQSAANSEPLSKVFQETQLVNKGVVKAASSATEETAGKVIKTETGTNDSGLLNSSGHNLQKTVEPAAVQKEIEAGQSGLRNQTLDQIVRQAAIHLRNGQHEVQIDLKPDFLGHIRMQISSANHQVTVKILAEHGFVKDMIENNIHQLKADLQQQGLEIDKLEVTVSRDSEDSGNYKDKFAQSKAKPNNANRQNEDSPGKEKKRENATPLRTPDGTGTVDYFA